MSGVVLLHGRGADGSDLEGLAPLLGLEGRVLCPDAPLRWPGGGGFCWYEDADRRGDIERSLGALEALLDEAAREDPRFARPVLGGFSQGGVMTLEAGLRRPGRFRALVVMSAFLAPDHPARETPPEPAAVPPLLLTHGTEDPVVPFELGEQCHEWLEGAGIAHRFVPDACGHAISPRHVSALRAFLQEVPDPPGGDPQEARARPDDT